ncbi:MAG: hypothetical protein A3B29_01215 [Candidatus Sungbacteria bacterium RIFCSPLOWO2_01_FULL_51_34]|nr:MAG: hypothetical protein A3B29_01215 [Candidatus Sungbacteria bacterium RIFCSPLOWO2_01_FULL_51_34]
MRFLRSITRRSLRSMCLSFINVYVFFAAPWMRAQFYAAWPRYQQDSVYRQRLTIMGFTYAFDAFLACKASREYVLRLRLADEPALKWRLRFLPWSIPIPDIFETVVRSGMFGESSGRDA